MKLLRDTKIIRGQVLADDDPDKWLPAADHLTDKGRSEFLARQLKRMAEAARARTDTKSHIAIFNQRRDRAK